MTNTQRDKLAQQLWRLYRLYRDEGYTPRLARTHAYFSVGSQHAGITNLFVDNCWREYQRRYYGK